MIADTEEKMNRDWTRIDANVVSYSRSLVSTRCLIFSRGCGSATLCNLWILFQVLR
jgi:hypothetical protein